MMTATTTNRNDIQGWEFATKRQRETCARKAGGEIEARDERATCDRCGGAGGFRHWPGFTCFKCGGSKRMDITNYYYHGDLQAFEALLEVIWQRKQARQEKKAAAYKAQMQREWFGHIVEIAHKLPEFVALCRALDNGEHADVYDIADKKSGFAALYRGMAKNGVTDDMVKRVARDMKYFQDKVEEAAKAVPVIEGKIEIAGTILCTRFQDSQYNGYGTLKMLVLDDRGFKVWGSVPSSIDSAQRGHRVVFTATVTVSDKDETFGFFKRPTKGNFLPCTTHEL